MVTQVGRRTFLTGLGSAALGAACRSRVSTGPLILRQRYPVPDAPYGLAGSSTLAWVSQTASNSVVGYDLSTGIPVEKVRYRTVQQPNSLVYDESSGTLYVVSGSGAGVQVISKAAVVR